MSAKVSDYKDKPFPVGAAVVDGMFSFVVAWDDMGNMIIGEWDSSENETKYGRDFFISNFAEWTVIL